MSNPSGKGWKWADDHVVVHINLLGILECLEIAHIRPLNRLYFIVICWKSPHLCATLHAKTCLDFPDPCHYHGSEFRQKMNFLECCSQIVRLRWYMLVRQGNDTLGLFALSPWASLRNRWKNETQKVDSLKNNKDCLVNMISPVFLFFLWRIFEEFSASMWFFFGLK